MAVFQNVLLRLNSFSYVTNIRPQLVNRLSTYSVLNYPRKLSLEEKLGIKPKPKKPLVPFLRYMALNRASILQQNPKATSPEVMKILAEHWKNENDSLKEKLNQEYIKERDKYYEDLKEYEKLLSPIDREEIARAKENLKNAKERKALKKKKEDLGYPRKPTPLFVHFMKDKLSERGNASFAEFQKKVKKDWDALPPEAKGKYEAIFKADMETYKKQLDTWISRMQEQGIDYSDITKRKHSSEPKKPGVAFTYFQKAKFPERGDMPFNDFSKKLVRDWEQLPTEEKKKYEEMRQKDLEVYELKCKAKKESKSKPGVRSQ